MTASYYSTDYLYAAREPVVLRVQYEDVIGWADFTPAGKPRWRVGSLTSYTELPKDAEVYLWRPINEATWPYQLPEPMEILDPQWKTPPEPQREPEAAISDEGWPYPGLRLGRPGEAPESLKECEARILRFLRTREHFERERPKIERAWPPELLTASAVVSKMLAAARTGRLGFLRQDDYADFHCDASDKRPLPARWDPTPRDVSEYEDGRVVRWIAPGAAKWLAWRAARPPYSFAQIGELIGVTDEQAKRHYEHQVEMCWRRARA